MRSASKVKGSGFASSRGRIPDGLCGNASTVRAQRVTNADSVQMLAAKRAGQIALVNGRPNKLISNRPQPQDVRGVMNQAMVQARQGAAIMRDARVR